MKKKLITVLTVVFALCLAIAVFAFNQSNVSSKSSADYCDKTDDCPLKKQNAEKPSTDIDMKNVTVAGSGENCCQPGADCCKGGSCCKNKHS
jgi:hypothetical protein